MLRGGEYIGSLPSMERSPPLMYSADPSSQLLMRFRGSSLGWRLLGIFLEFGESKMVDLRFLRKEVIVDVDEGQNDV